LLKDVIYYLIEPNIENKGDTMSEKKVTLGQAIDQIIDALNSLEPEARLTAVEAACSHLEIKIGSSRMGSPPPATPQPPVLPGTPPAPVNPLSPDMDIRTLKEEKKPKSARQMACIVAYYLLEIAPETERRITVNTQVLEKYFKQAKFKLPRSIGQILPDAKAAGYFEAASGKGEYILNAVGYNLVAHNLPTSKGE